MSPWTSRRVPWPGRARRGALATTRSSPCRSAAPQGSPRANRARVRGPGSSHVDNAHIVRFNAWTPPPIRGTAMTTPPASLPAATAALRGQHADQPPANPFLTGAFAPVSEEVTARQLKVQGELPKDLNGLYVRIGPNPVKHPKADKHHWFVGDGMVHGLKLREGQALWYRNRYIGSATVQKALGRPLVPGETRGIFDTVNTNVYGHAGRIWASVEAGPTPVQLDGELNSVRHGMFDSPARHPYSAHPHLDPVTG